MLAVPQKPFEYEKKLHDKSLSHLAAHSSTLGAGDGTGGGESLEKHDRILPKPLSLAKETLL